MTVAELKKGVALLGFEETLSAVDDTAESHFWYATNRALWTVNRLRPKKGVYSLCHFSPKNLLPYENHRHRSGVDLSFSVFGGKSYSFSVSGTGSFVIENGGKTLEHSWENQKNCRFVGLLSPGETTLTFSGEYDYPVTELALWDASLGKDKSAIPEGSPYAIYQLRDYIPDFLRLDEKPFGEDCPNFVKILGPGEIGVLREREETISLCYRKKWEALDENTSDQTPLPLDEDLCQLLPTLVASELCLDADQDKAAYYRRLYGEQAGELALEYTPHTPSAFRSHNNW